MGALPEQNQMKTIKWHVMAVGAFMEYQAASSIWASFPRACIYKYKTDSSTQGIL